MYKKYFDEFDEIKAPKIIVDNAVAKALDSAYMKDRKSNSEVYLFGHKRKFGLSIMAACLAVVFAITLSFGFSTEHLTADKKSNGFVITANAYEVKRLGENVDSATIGAYTGELSGGWAMYYNLERYKDFSPNFFQSYVFSSFTVEGKGIESVTFKSNAKGTYFALSPAGIYCNSDEDKAMDSYSQLSLNNSQYSAEELKAYSDGLSFGDIYCDVFTFTNVQKSEKIDFSKKLEFVIESSHNNPLVSEKLDRLWEYEQMAMDYKSEVTFDGGKVSDEKEKVDTEIDMLSEEIRQLVLSDATVDVIVKFADGSTLTKILKMELVRVDSTLWLTVGEI